VLRKCRDASLERWSLWFPSLVFFPDSLRHHASPPSLPPPRSSPTNDAEDIFFLSSPFLYLFSFRPGRSFPLLRFGTGYTRHPNHVPTFPLPFSSSTGMASAFRSSFLVLHAVTTTVLTLIGRGVGPPLRDFRCGGSWLDTCRAAAAFLSSLGTQLFSPAPHSFVFGLLPTAQWINPIVDTVRKPPSSRVEGCRLSYLSYKTVFFLCPSWCLASLSEQDTPFSLSLLVLFFL